MELDPNLIYRQASFTTRDALFEQVGADLIAQGYVKDSYPTALKEREASFPTGLPVPGGVAIPHTDASHVLKDGLVVITLTDPIEFGEMGGDATDTVDTSVVLMLVLADGKAHVKFLAKTVKAIQDAQFVSALSSAASTEEITSTVTTKLGL